MRQLGLPGDLVRVWETENGKTVAELPHTDPIDWVAVEAGLRSRLSERAAALELKQLQSGSVNVLAVSSSGRFVATLRDADETLRFWDTNSSQVIHQEHAERAPLLEFLSDTAVLRIDDRDARFGEAPHRRRAAVVRAAETHQVTGGVRRSSTHPRCGATWTRDPIIRVWDAASGKRLLDQQAESKGGEVVFDRSGRYAAAAVRLRVRHSRRTPAGAGLKIWDLSSGREVVSLPGSQRVVGLAFSRDSRRVAIALQQGGLIVQDLQSGQMNRTVGASVGPVAFSSSGDLLAFGGRSIRVVETESLRVVAQVDVMRQARRVEFRSGDAVLAVDSFPDGDPRGLTQLLRWKPEDVLSDACRVMPIDAAIKQWQQLFQDSPVPSPCAGAGRPESSR